MPISGYFLETWSGKRPGIWVIRSNVHFPKMAGNLGAGNSEKDGIRTKLWNSFWKVNRTPYQLEK